MPVVGAPLRKKREPVSRLDPKTVSRAKRGAFDVEHKDRSLGELFVDFGSLEVFSGHPVPEIEDRKDCGNTSGLGERGPQPARNAALTAWLEAKPFSRFISATRLSWQISRPRL
jgi:hypothetical protein